MANQQDWDIKSRSDHCRGSDEAFADGQQIVSRLIYSGEDGYIREDFSVPGWDALEDQGGLSVWRSRFRLPPPPEEEALRKETAETLLRKLIESEDASKLNVMYILAVMLERKRILAEQDVQTREDGMKIRIYEHKKTGESFTIPDPGLKLNELEHVQEEVVVMLGGKPRNPPEETPENTSEEEAKKKG